MTGANSRMGIGCSVKEELARRTGAFRNRLIRQAA
jgi:hypothetical protein